MTRDEVLDRLQDALIEVDEIDLRGRRAGTPIHTAVVTVRGALTEAIEALGDEE